MQLATRLSVNMEAPTAAHLARIAPSKNFATEILAPMRQVSRAIAEGRFARAGQTRQLVVGAAGEADREVATAAAWAYSEMGLARVYYSAMQPVPGTPVANRPPVAFGREHRLYQVDFLLRSYGFSVDEIEFDASGALSLDVDPKTAWARRHPERFPVEINTAARAELLRIPGIGPRAADRLEQMRQKQRLRDVAVLRAAGASWRVASPFVLLDGKPADRQMSFDTRL
jgi:predicted DNA-binding helix-hairpin-helix protein